MYSLRFGKLHDAVQCTQLPSRNRTDDAGYSKGRAGHGSISDQRCQTQACKGGKAHLIKTLLVFVTP